MVLMAMSYCAAVYIDDWKLIAGSNGALSIAELAYYHIYFYGRLTACILPVLPVVLGEMTTDSFCLIYFLNSSTLFYFVYEKSFRYLFFVEREIKRVSRKSQLCCRGNCGGRLCSTTSLWASCCSTRKGRSSLSTKR